MRALADEGLSHYAIAARLGRPANDGDGGASAVNWVSRRADT
jgi:hypothetical protein